MTELIELRWSAISTFMKCQRKYQLGYIEQLVRRTDRTSRARLLGSTVHAGIQGALLHLYDNPDATTRELVRTAIQAAKQYQRDEVKPNKTDWKGERDEEYYFLWAEVVMVAEKILTYQIPRIGLGTKWRVAAYADVFTDSPTNFPIVEYKFYYTHASAPNIAFTGTIDAILIDKDTDDLVIFDWKTRGIMPDEVLVDLDGQLRFYAMCIALGGGRTIDRVIQYEIRNTVPKPAELTEKTKKISRSQTSSTWEVWSQSVKDLGHDPNDYLDVKEKLHEPTAFTNAIETPIMKSTLRAMFNNVMMIANAMRYSQSQNSYPAIPSHTGCQFCEFKRVCGQLEHGNDATHILVEDFEKGEQDDELDPVLP